jgi:prepilin-type processing-associated H-X9-DG protein
LYQFNHVPSFDAWGNYTFCDGHVCHGIELPFVFHAAAPYYKFTPAEDDLSQYARHRRCRHQDSNALKIRR